jgi:hypothetical protein
MLVCGHLLLLVMSDRDLVLLLLRVLSQVLVLVGDRPLLPVLMGRGLLIVLLQLMLFMMLLMFLLLQMQLPELARAHVLLLVTVCTYLRLVVGPLVVLIQVLVLVGDQLFGLVGRALQQVVVV